MRGGITGKGFEPGVSGNRSGRPKAAKGLRQRLQKTFGTDAGVLVAELEKLVKSRNEKTRLAAVELCLAYAFGKPRQAFELEVGEQPEALHVYTHTLPPDAPLPSDPVGLRR